MRIVPVLLLLVFVTLSHSIVIGQTSLKEESWIEYSDDELSKFQGRFKRNVEWNFRYAILTNLNEAELGRLAEVKLEFPLHAPGGNPFQYYSSPTKKTVTLPVVSIKFLADLSIAAGWLLNNGYSLDTLAEYSAVLSFGRLPVGWKRFPNPLHALSIPADAFSDETVERSAQATLKSALIWILCHELAHIYYSHAGHTDGASTADLRSEEMEADRFATDVMRRIALPPGGLVVYFLAATCYERTSSDFPDLVAWQRYLERRVTHPLSSVRLKALGQAIADGATDFADNQLKPTEWIPRIRGMGRQIRRIGELLEDKDVRRVLRVLAVGECPERIPPRRRAKIFQRDLTILEENSGKQDTGSETQ